MEIFALDLGNKQTKLASSKNSYRLPSHFTNLQTGGLNEVTMNNNDNVDVDVFEYNDKLYRWGKDIDLVSNPVNIKDTIAFGSLRYEQNTFKLLCAFAIAKLANDFVDKDSDTLEVNVVAGLPTEDFENSECFKSLKDDLYQHFNISINGKPMDIQVKNVIIIPQPIGTIYDTVYNQKRKEIASELINVIDCGGGTTLIDTLNNLEYDVDNTTQCEDGSYKLFKAISRRINETTRPNIYNIEASIRNGMEDGKFTYHIKKGVDIDITDIVKEEIDNFTDAIIQDIYSNVFNLGSIDELIFTGGGSKIINQDKIKKAFPNSSFSKHGEMSNVFGFYQFGKKSL